MKIETVKKILQNMFENKTVKLRRSRVGGISEKTWDSITDVLFSCGYKSIEYYPTDNGHITVKLDDDFI
jgi:hypothetical protein